MESTQIIVMMSILLLLVGCGGRGSSSSSDSDDTSFRTGVQGIELSLPTNSPIRFIENSNGGSDNDEEMVLEVHNKGAFTEKENINLAKIWVGGYDKELLKVKYENNDIGDKPLEISVQSNPELEGKSPYNPIGGRKPFILTIHPLKLPDRVNKYSPNIKFAVSYTYETLATELICYDPNPRSTSDIERGCSFTKSASLESQGGPVAVTRIEQDITGGNTGKAIYRVYFENKGNGRVLDYSVDSKPVDKNPFTEGYKLGDVDEVSVRSIKIGDRNAEASKCRPGLNEKVVKLIDNKGVIFCEFNKKDLPNQAVETLITIQLAYGYTHTITHRIDIESESTI
ncbi:MAG: hypothetical protein O2779_05360 [Nanoarchaeota archaeon]|nr:hypothetical protein [Nanoarchaeota archaeon]